MDHNTAVYHSGKKLTKEMVIDSYVYNFKSPRHSKNPHFEKYTLKELILIFTPYVINEF